jgi:hypothetical protein
VEGPGSLINSIYRAIHFVEEKSRLKEGIEARESDINSFVLLSELDGKGNDQEATNKETRHKARA